MNPAINGLKYLLSNKKSLVYSTFDLKGYTRAAANLQAAGIPFRTASYSSPRETGAAYSDLTVQFKVYVKKEHQSEAQKVIHQR
ncbi:hypothetical protein [Halobacillus salinus]|uniref:DUF2007 domain-containing protein n=1 Tax=Halobacillus salinus TaxID=192814 RepID=A0A4Z0GW92_9BACI|nr:hypothetical protein [Halobacillus salinus]TGB02026.1 hypothetical protein E4663_15455 [Halobacillus salinus]